MSGARFFKPTVLLDALPDGEHFILREPLVFYSARRNQTVVAPTGLVSDLASTPWGTRNWFPKSGPWNRPALVHDAGYKLRLQTIDGARLYLSKREVDDLFDEALAVVDDEARRRIPPGKGIAAWKRAVMVQAVRWFGHGQFKARRPEHLREV